jgi:hypothetical protein
MFFTRPNLAPLGLDLVAIDGGGASPSQFNGRTADGRDVYIRYRGGHFSVHLDEKVVLEAVIGPPFHGDILVEQACDLAGLTVRGERLILSEERRRAAAEQRPILDWSGRTTYWERWFATTKERGLKFFDILREAHPDCLLIEMTFSQDYRRLCRLQKMLSQCGEDGDGAVTLGIGAEPRRVAALLSSSDYRLADLAGAFAHTLYFGFRHPDPRNRTPYPFSDAAANDGSEPIQLLGNLKSQFTTGDSQARAFVEEVVAAADACFPAPASGQS